MKDSEARCELLSIEIDANAAVYANERASLLLKHEASLNTANVEVLPFAYQFLSKKVFMSNMNRVTE